MTTTVEDISNTSIAQMLQQIENLKHRNKIKLDEILENEHAMGLLTYKINEIYTARLAAKEPPKQ